MIYIYLLVSLLFIFVTHRIMAKEISTFVHRLGGDGKAFITLWSAVFLPGTILHEVSHFLVALALGVRTGKVEVLPEFIEDTGSDNNKVHLGYVQVAKMNPLQGFFVGFAPLITGSGVLVWLSTLIPTYYDDKNYWLLALVIYIFFAVANSFFPSWQDIKQTLVFVFIVVIFLIAFFLFGFKVSLTIPSSVINIINVLSRTFILSGVLNVVISAPLFFLRRSK